MVVKTLINFCPSINTKMNQSKNMYETKMQMCRLPVVTSDPNHDVSTVYC